MRPFTKEQDDAFLASLDKRFASAGILLELPDGKLLTVKSGYKKRWSIPGGVIDAKESPLQAACREVREEVGLTIDPADTTFAFVMHRHSERLGNSYAFIFRADLSTMQLSHVILEAAEIDEMATVSKQDVLADVDKYNHSVVAWATGEQGYIERAFD